MKSALSIFIMLLLLPISALLFQFAVAPPSSQEGQQINQWFYLFVELAKVSVIFAGGYFSHWLLTRRDVVALRREFIGKMAQCIQEARNQTTDNLWTFYRNKTPNIQYEAAKVTFFRRGDFQALLENATNLKEVDLKGPNGQIGADHILERWRKLKEYAERGLPTD